MERCDPKSLSEFRQDKGSHWGNSCFLQRRENNNIGKHFYGGRDLNSHSQAQSFQGLNYTDELKTGVHAHPVGTRRAVTLLFSRLKLFIRHTIWEALSDEGLPLALTFLYLTI